MSSNINQIYIANPATELLNDDLLYVGRSPYGLTDDFAIKVQNIFPSSVANTGNLAAYADTTGKQLKDSLVSFAGGHAFVGTLTADTNVTFPTSGTLATTAQVPSFPITVTEGGTGLISTVVNQLLYSSATNTIAGLATVNRAAFATSATGVPTWLALADGQIVIGSTSGAPAAATLSAGAGVSISQGSNSITISGTGSGIGWTEITGTTQLMVADNGYVANNAGTVTFTLPALAAFGTAISIIGKGAGGWAIAQNALQVIQVGSVGSTAGVGGSVASTNAFDSIDLICTTANTVWTTLGGSQGNLTIV